MAAAKTATVDLAFGMASISEVEAILVTALVAALIAIWGIITQRTVARRLATIERIAELEADRDMIKAREKFNEISAPGGKLAHSWKPEDLSAEELDAIRLVLNDFELTAIGIQHGILDFNIVKQFQKGTMLRDWARAAAFVKSLRTELNRPLIYYELETLVDWFEKDRRPKRRMWMKLWF